MVSRKLNLKLGGEFFKNTSDSKQNVCRIIFKKCQENKSSI